MDTDKLEQIVALLFSAVPSRLFRKLPYEQVIHLMSERWYHVTKKANPNNIFILFMMVYHSDSDKLGLFSADTRDKILSDFVRMKDTLTDYPGTFTTALFHTYQKGVPYSAVIDYLNETIRNRVALSEHVLQLGAATSCSDMAPDHASYVMRPKMPIPKQLL